MSDVAGQDDEAGILEDGLAGVRFPPLSTAMRLSRAVTGLSPSSRRYRP